MAFQLDPNEIKKAMNFKGVIAESTIRTIEGKDIWSITVYNEDTGEFGRAESVNDVDPSSGGYVRSGLYKRITSYHKLGIKPNTIEDFEGWQCDFEVKVSDWEFEGRSGTSVKTFPTKKHGKVEADVLAGLKSKLADLRAKARQGGGGFTAATTSAAPRAELDRDTISLLLSLYDGRTDDEVQGEAFSRNLDPILLNMVSTGSAAQHLIGSGLLDLDEEGKYILMGAE